MITMIIFLSNVEVKTIFLSCIVSIKSLFYKNGLYNFLFLAHKYFLCTFLAKKADKTIAHTNEKKFCVHTMNSFLSTKCIKERFVRQKYNILQTIFIPKNHYMDTKFPFICTNLNFMRFLANFHIKEIILYL